jgi:hypothetical protein
MMRTPRKSPPFFNWLTLLLGLLLAIVLLGGFWAAILVFREPVAVAKGPDAAITIVAAPTLTPMITMPAVAPTGTPTPGSSQNGVPATNGAIAKGMYVQISGTGGSGLRLRAQPGTASQSLFLGMESEVYLVQDGPQEKDGYKWYYLVAPYDKSRSGWAASNYLTIIQKPTP